MDMVLDEPRAAVVPRSPVGTASRVLPVRLVVRFDGRFTRRWHIDLLDRLAGRGDILLSVDLAPGQHRPIPGLAALFRLEAVLGHAAPTGLAAAAPAPDIVRAVDDFDAGPDLTLDLCGDVAAAGRVWTIRIDGVAGEAALPRLLLDGRTPLVEVCEGTRVVAAGRLGTESGGVASAAFEDILARLSTLILAALSGAASTPLPHLPDDADRPADGGGTNVAAFAAKSVVRSLVRQAYRACYRAPHWRTGWRRLDGPDLFDLRRHPRSGWRDLPDDGRRFYADPFPVERDGQVTLFVEDFEHRRGKGVISAVAFGPDGPVGRPVPVLEQPGHLSYPFVFAHEGAMWMIPESGSAGTVDLFRATAFPGGWIKEATLLSGIVASDATLVRHGGSWWLFATVRADGGAFSDALHLWFADDLLGPWTAHPRNPVLIDIASARPAGRMIHRGGALLRPVQDCRRGYGAALGIARVTRLDPDGFDQVVEAIVTPGPLWDGRRLHTLNAAGGFEFIDGSAFAPRWRRGTA